MIIMHAGQWYEGTSAERISIGLPTRNGVWFHDTDEGALYYLFNGTWINLSVGGGGYNPLVYSSVAGGVVATDDVETDMFSYTLPADTLVAGSVLRFKFTVYVDNDVNLDSGLLRLRCDSSYGNVIVMTSPVITCDGSGNFYIVFDGSVVVDGAGDDAFGSYVLGSGDETIMAPALGVLVLGNPFDVDSTFRFTGQMGGTGNGLLGYAAEIYVYQPGG